MTRNDVYYKSWRAGNGILYRWLFCPADIVDRAAPNTYELPDYLITNQATVSIEYPDKLPRGVPLTGTTKLTLNLKALTGDLAPLKEWMRLGVHPTPKNAIGKDLYIPNLWILQKYRYSTVMEEYYWDDEIVFVQDKKPERKITIKKNIETFEITLIMIDRYLQENCFAYNPLLFLADSKIEKNRYVDYKYTDGEFSRQVFIGYFAEKNGETLVAIPTSDFFASYNNMLRDVYRAVIRDASVYWANNVNLFSTISLYRSTDTKANTLGTALSISDTYIIILVKKGDAVVSWGFLGDPDQGISPIDSYSMQVDGNFHDFLTKQADSLGIKMVFNHTLREFGYHRPFSILSEIVINDAVVNDITIDQGYKTLVKASISENDTNTRVDEVQRGISTENADEFKVYLTTFSPPPDKRKAYPANPGSPDPTSHYWWVTNNAMFNRFYYLDGDGVLRKAHDTITINYGGSGGGAAYTNTAVASLPDFVFNDSFTAELISRVGRGDSLQSLAQMKLKAFANLNQSLLEITTMITSTDDGGNVPDYYINANTFGHGVTLNLPELAEFYGLSAKGIITGMELDYIKGTVKLSIFMRDDEWL